MALNGLFDDIDFNRTEAKKTIAKIIEEIENGESVDSDIDKVLKSDKVSVEEKIPLIHERILKVLGKQKKNVVCIFDRDEFHDYMTAAIESGVIAIDTETNNSLDPITCKLMGLCLYYPGGKAAYIPVNHRDRHTKKRLDFQLTEQDVHDELMRIVNLRNNWTPEFTNGHIETQTFLEYWVEHSYKNGEHLECPLTDFHNGKFDQEVLICTCGVKVPVDFDSFIAQRLLDENDLAGLKYLYTKFIDRTQAKYNLDSLYMNTAYADSDPDIFTLYAATDSRMTYAVLMLLLPKLLEPKNANLFKLFTRVEMRILEVTAAQELLGMKVDTLYGEKLKVKYDNLVLDLDARICEELNKYTDQISNWRLSLEANQKTHDYVSEKTSMTQDKIEKTYPLIDSKGNRYRIGKSKAEKLENPITVSALNSPTQLAILLYDILECPIVDEDKPRGTGEDILDAINERVDLPILKMIIKKRGYLKLLSTYIDTIPTLAAHWPDGRVRFHLNQLGAGTGRFSSGGTIGYMDNYGTTLEKRVEVSGMNIQNIPSYCTNIRSLFIGETTYTEHEDADGAFEVPEYEEVETNNGWKYCIDLTDDDLLNTEDGLFRIKNRTYLNDKRAYLLEV